VGRTAGESKWQFAVTDRLRLDVWIAYDHGDPTKFSLNLCGLLGGKWEPLVRYDNAHGPAHRHVFHADGTEDEHPFVAILPETFIDQAQKELIDHATVYLEEFERDLSNISRGVR
jgi:hypothetical protein